ncbi:G-protein coupled receptor family C group 6 member A-like [Anguilla rostrata]|uniref:G-protein coupled receptor family C group 6 member A-like n=1 Tax=Anguilla rostrata TaxID=7938 RepID=UPI0030CA79D2
MLCWFTWRCLGMCALFCLGGCCDNVSSICGAHSPGDILIGVLSPCHSKVDTLHEQTEPKGFNCTNFDLQSFVRTLAVIHTIDTINDSGFLPGVRLGYVVCDTCSHATKAVQIAQHLLSVNGSLSVQCDLADRVPVKAIIGARYSEVSITVARFLGLHLVPQISTTSSAEILSDKLRFPSFLRTIPSDVHQTRALARFMANFDWNWVGVVSGDDDYGRAALLSFMQEAEKAQVCLAFHEVVPHYLDHADSERRIQEVAEQIRSSDARVILLILKDQLVVHLFQEAMEANISRIWIASDAWSMSRNVAGMEGIDSVGDIFGLSFITGEIPGFEEYLQNLQPGPGATNTFIEEYKKLRFECIPELPQLLQQHNACLAEHPPALCSLPDSLLFKSPLACNLSEPQKANDDFLVQGVNLNLSYNERVATWAIAHALRELLQCNETFCSADNFPPWKLLRELKKVNFTVDNRRFYFDKSGNFLNGYHLIHWVKDGSNKRRFKVVGEYNLIKRDVQINRDDIDWGNTNNTAPESKCSQPCHPGYVKKVSNISCCYNCTECEEGTYSDVENMDTCLSCPSGTWSKRGWSQCQTRVETFFTWNEPYAIVLLTGTALGELLLFAILVVFLAGRKSPAVKVAGGWFCYVMIAGLAVSFASVVLFVGRPNVRICQARQTMYGLGFTLCLSCVLVKAFRTFLAFLFDLYRQHRLRKLYKPVAIIALATVGQGLVCLFWLLFDSPGMEISYEGLTAVLQCREGSPDGSQAGFGAMHSYVALLACVCLLLALKGRKVPQRYNDTGYIIFSVLIYLFVWVCFIPVYVTKIQQRSAVQASAILASNFGMVFCHFMPKCYMILCKKKAENSPEAYLERVRIFSITSVHSAFARRSQDSGMSSLGTATPRGSVDFSPARGSVCSTIKEEPQASAPPPLLRRRTRRCSV